MISIKTVLSAAAVAGLMSGALVTTTAPAAARVVCNNQGDCWHTDAPPPRIPGITFSAHPDDWYFHQTWENNNDRHYRDYHSGRGYYKGGVWITL